MIHYEMIHYEIIVYMLGQADSTINHAYCTTLYRKRMSGCLIDIHLRLHRPILYHFMKFGTKHANYI